MRKCAFLTMDSLSEFECYDELLYEPLRKIGWDTEAVSWRKKNADWDQYEVVIIRSPWDYQNAPDAFMNVLETIENSSARLENDLDLVKWNIRKTYLRDIEKKGVTIVPTLWGELLTADALPQYFDALGSDEIVIKPVISANADDTFRLKADSVNEMIPQLCEIFKSREYMVQPFMKSIVDEGEYSVFFFGDVYSHTILKTPKREDFRVQEEHGAMLRKVEPEEDLLLLAQDTLKEIDPKPLYSRIDFVRFRETFAVMEIELIEPSLYFNLDPDSPERFAKAFKEWMAAL